jgi:hypothetical protein
MSVALVPGQAIINAGSVAASTAQAYPGNVTKGNLLVVIDSSQGASLSTTAVSISDTLGNTWTPVWGSIQSPAGGSVNKFIQGWYCLSKSSGANTVTCVITQTGAIGAHAVSIAEFSGFSGSAILDQKSNAASAGSTSMNALSFVNALPNDAMFVVTVTNAVQTPTPSVNSPFTGLNFGGSLNFELAYGTSTTPATKNFSGTWTVGTATMQWAAGFTISAGSGVPNSLMMMGVGT